MPLILKKTQYNTNKKGREKKIDDASKKYFILVDLLKTEAKNTLY